MQTCLVLLDARDEGNEALHAQKHWKVELSKDDVDCPKGVLDFCMVSALDLVLETH